jgi:Uma2 family endonuclease
VAADAGFLFMRTDELISVREYLHTSYSPDCDYVDGVVVERNVGEKDHGKLQRELLVYFHARRKEWRAHVFPEQRVQVSATRFRVPDVCVVVGTEPDEQVFRTPPFICIEILSPEDRFSLTLETCDDYLKMGVPYVWILNPEDHRAWRCLPGDTHEVTELRTENPEMVVPLAALFEE